MNSDALLKTITGFFVVAGYFFVPILALTGFLNLGALKNGIQKRIFLTIALCMTFCYAVLGHGAARYLLIPLLLIGCLAGAGLEFIANTLIWITKRITKQNVFFKKVLILIIASVAVIVCVWRCWTHNRTECMDEFASLILNRNQNDSVIVFGVDCNSFPKLRGILNEEKEIVCYNTESWEKAMDILVPIQNSDSDFYFCVEMPKKYELSDYRNWFQSLYYLFPFDVITDCFKGSKRYALLLFNHKTMDGIEDSFDTTTLERLSSPLPFKKWNKLFSVSSFRDYLPDSLLQNRFVEASRCTWCDGALFTRMHLQEENSPVSLILRNDIFWPESTVQRCFVETEDNTSLKQTNDTSVIEGKREIVPAQTAEPVLLHLIPNTPIVVSESNPVIYLSGAIPGWFSGSKRFLINGDEKDLFIPSEGKNELIIQDQYLKSSITEDIDVAFYSHNDKMEKSSILLLEDNCSDTLKLKENLPNVFPSESTIEQIILNPFDILSDSNSMHQLADIPQKDYDVIVLNVFIDAIKRPWLLQFETDCAFESVFESLIQKVESKFPRSRIIVVLPPSPPSSPSMYPSCDSFNLDKLSHYRACSAALRWKNKHHNPNLTIIPLYFFCNQEKDYTINTSFNGISIKTGYFFTREALTRFANTISDYFEWLSFQ